MARLDEIKRFYGILAQVENHCGRQQLDACSGRICWPDRGVYFFFEDGEARRESGAGLRVVRVGTHALIDGGNSTLWGRLRQHRGTVTHGGGNHRGSVFRKHVGFALMRRHLELLCATWGIGNNANAKTRADEHSLECLVSEYIGKMPFLWLEVNDDPGPNSKRGYIEKNSIALLSNRLHVGNVVVDQASPEWLGRDCPNQKVGESGLWNSNHVDDEYQPGFLDALENLVHQMISKCPSGR